MAFAGSGASGCGYNNGEGRGAFKDSFGGSYTVVAMVAIVAMAAKSRMAENRRPEAK